MSAEPVDPTLVNAARSRARWFAQELRSVTDTSAMVPGLEWTVADLAQHVACLPSYWRSQDDAGDTFDRPDDFAAFSDQARAHITTTDAHELADLIDNEFDEHLTTLQSGGTRWVYGRSMTATNLVGMVLSETIVHGADLAGVTGSKAPVFTRDEANAAVDASMIMAPAFFDAEKATKQPDGIYRVSFRGGKDYTWTKQGADVTITEGKPDRADATLNADPATFVLSSLGRLSDARAALSGKIISYGRKPWRFLGLGKIVADGV